MIHVALVEDHAPLREEIAFLLEHQGYRVSPCADGATLDTLLAVEGCDVVVLDVGLPGEDGFSIAERLRPIAHLGIIMLTARSTLEDRVRGLRGGADAYLVKPVDSRELAAVIESVVRRLPEPDEEADAWQLRAGGRRLLAPDGTIIELTHAEAALLNRLAADAPHPVPREELMKATVGAPLGTDSRRLEVALSRLRMKIINRVPDIRSPLRAARGKGYAFVAPIRATH